MNPIPHHEQLSFFFFCGGVEISGWESRRVGADSVIWLLQLSPFLLTSFPSLSSGTILSFMQKVSVSLFPSISSPLSLYLLFGHALSAPSIVLWAMLTYCTSSKCFFSGEIKPIKQHFCYLTYINPFFSRPCILM